MSADIMDHFANEIAKKLASENDALIRRNITRRIGPNWTESEIIPRLRWEIDPEKPEKLLLLDEQPLLLLWPPSSNFSMEDDRHMINWSVRYQEIP